MATISVVISDERFSVEAAQLTAHALRRWPGAEWEPARGRVAEVAVGTLHVPDAATATAAEVLLHTGGKSLDVEGADDALIAELLAYLTTAPGFPTTGVHVYEWSADPLTLAPGIDAGDLLEQRDG